MDATSRPQELDEVSRRLLRVEMEQISLAAEAEDEPMTPVRGPEQMGAAVSPIHA